LYTAIVWVKKLEMNLKKACKNTFQDTIEGGDPLVTKTVEVKWWISYSL